MNETEAAEIVEAIALRCSDHHGAFRKGIAGMCSDCRAEVSALFRWFLFLRGKR
jgi:hypothetical protein